METGETVVGVETHLRVILDVVDRLASVIEAENKRISWTDQAEAVLRNVELQDSKMRLYQKFETLARIIGNIARTGAVEDKDLVRSAIPRILHLRRMITINNVMLQNHIEQQQRLLTSIMEGIENDSADGKPGDTSSSNMEFLCR